MKEIIITKEDFDNMTEKVLHSKKGEEPEYTICMVHNMNITCIAIFSIAVGLFIGAKTLWYLDLATIPILFFMFCWMFLEMYFKPAIHHLIIKSKVHGSYKLINT